MLYVKLTAYLFFCIIKNCYQMSCDWQNNQLNIVILGLPTKHPCWQDDNNLLKRKLHNLLLISFGNIYSLSYACSHGNKLAAHFIFSFISLRNTVKSHRISRKSTPLYDSDAQVANLTSYLVRKIEACCGAGRKY